MVLDYRPATREESTVSGTKDCIHIDMPGRTQGRVWVDRDTHAVLRLDESIVAVTDVRVPRELQKGGWGLHVTVERADSTIRYQPVAFSEPDETLLTVPVFVARQRIHCCTRSRSAVPSTCLR